ncbi:MAG: hypothetical protein M3321_02405 [Actinomycetota bacterium]|nr:hypothetical protein [Actinomycetota bacterium]
MARARLPALETRIDRELEHWRSSETERRGAFGLEALMQLEGLGLNAGARSGWRRSCSTRASACSRRSRGTGGAADFVFEKPARQGAER